MNIGLSLEPYEIKNRIGVKNPDIEIPAENKRYNILAYDKDAGNYTTLKTGIESQETACDMAKELIFSERAADGDHYDWIDIILECNTDEERREFFVCIEKDQPKLIRLSDMDIGSCKVDEDGKIVELVRGPSEEGMIFKSWYNFYNELDAPCYVPELSDTVYTARDFLYICKCQLNFAELLFELSTWQHPESLFEQLCADGLLDVCPVCKSIMEVEDDEENRTCPHCGNVF